MTKTVVDGTKGPGRRRDPHAEPTEALQVYLPISVKRALAHYANDHGISMNAVVTALLREKLGVRE